jgi:serine protease AprX
VKDNGKVYILTDIVDNTPIYTTTDNLNAARATGTMHLQIGGSLGLDLDGAGRTVGVWDGGPLTADHVEFQNETNTASRIINVEVINTEGGTETTNHGTHVTGTISAKGINPAAKGMATAALIRTWNFIDPSIEMVNALSNPTAPIYVSSHSYGVPISAGPPTWTIGSYGATAREFDDILRTYPKHIMVRSAGNAGEDSYDGNGLAFGFDKMTSERNAKNNIVVASVNPTINPFTGGVTFEISSFISQGPTDDLRIKPDIAGDGQAVFSTFADGGYGTIGGTSMATPNVSGSLVLLQQYYEQLHGMEINSATLRGLICYTATHDTNRIGPDPRFGWGLLNAKRAAEVMTEYTNGLAIIEELTLNNTRIYTRDFSVGAQTGDKLSATICWTDVPGLIVTEADANDTTVKSLVNDLDIRIIKDGVEYLPWRLEYNGSGFFNSKGDNISDNIERVDIDVPEPGIYTLVVSHKGALQGVGAFDPQEQDFYLIVSGVNLTLSTTDVALSNSLRIHPNPSKGEFTISFDAGASIQNDVKVQIYDLSGRQVFNVNFDSTSQFFSETINLNNIQSGIYMANISQGNNVTSRKIIIE